MASTRKRSLVPIVLFCVLVTLVAARIVNALRPVQIQPQAPTVVVAAPTQDQTLSVDPTKVRVIAQLAGAAAVAAADNAPAPVSNTCSATPPKKEDPKTEACKDTNVNIASYVTPSCGGTGKSCGVVAASSVTLTDSNIGNVQNEVIDLGGGLIKQRSNDIFFLYQSSGGFVRLLQDTIWGGGPAGGFFTCDGTTDQAFYRVFDAQGNWGGKQFPDSASCGTEFSDTSVLQTFKKVSDAGLDINDPNTPPDIDASQLTACNVTGQTGIPSGHSATLIFQGPAICNGVPFDMIAIQNGAGSGGGETTMYCKDQKTGQGKGLCAFYQTLDLSKPENQPTSWTKDTDICDLKAGGSRAKLPTYFEYNIQRECGKTPVKVLNNFMDEYSVSCMPESSYILDIVNQKNCSKSQKGCLDWNSTGDLNFSAGGNLFGLFRNESAVESRYNTMNGLKDKSRQESIEAFLTAKVDKLPSAGTVSLSQQAATTQTTNLNRADPNKLSVYQSPLYKLTTLEQQCDLVYDKLVAVKELCDPINRIEGEENAECAINQFLPNTSTRYIDIISAMQDPNDNTKSKCLSLMSPDASNPPAKALRDQILSIDPAMEVAYRPAFIVVASYVGDPIMTNPQFDSQGPNGTLDKSYFYQVDYLEVKVPTFGSDFLNRKYNESASNKERNRPGSTYRDPLRFMADAMTPPEIQEKYRVEEENDRNAIRAKARSIVGDTSDPNAATATDPTDGTSKFLTPGDIIGLGGIPIKCRSGKGAYSAQGCDNIAKALVTFINSSTVVPSTPGQGANGTSVTRQFSPPRGWLPASKCEIFEEDLYGNSVLTEDPVAEEYQHAEQADSVGSKLEARDVGQYNNKHKESHAETGVNVPDLNGNPPPRATNFGHTQVFYISPHNYTLLYAQNAMLSMLTLEQKQAFLKNSNFNAAMKTVGLDKYTSFPEDSSYWTAPGTDENGPLVSQDTPGAVEHIVSLDMKRKRGPGGKELDSPLMWQVAGAVANIPTRVFTFVTEQLNSPKYLYALGCTGDHATENWLTDKCKPATPGTSPSPTPIVQNTNPSGLCVQLRVDETIANAANAALPTTLKAQQTASPTFAGWEAYFGVTDRPQDQHLFYPDCQGGQYCYNYIINTIKGTGLNPYLVMAIALNETGGLISNKPGFVGPHFGCGIGSTGGGATIGDGSIESKLQCLVGFFEGNSELTADAALKKYGYTNGVREDNLVKIVGILGGSATLKCEGTGTPASSNPPLENLIR